MSKTLLMIHGIGCGGDAWDRMRPGFEAAGWACEAPTLFPDQRTLDNPPVTLSDLGFDDYVAAMAEAARKIARETGAKPAVIGHSMGGLIAQCLAERGLVSQAVFLTPAQPKDCSEVSLSVAYTFLNILLTRDRKRAYKVWRSGFRFGVLNRVPRRRHDDIYARARFDSGKVYGDLTARRWRGLYARWARNMPARLCRATFSNIPTMHTGLSTSRARMPSWPISWNGWTNRLETMRDRGRSPRGS